MRIIQSITAFFFIGLFLGGLLGIILWEPEPGMFGRMEKILGFFLGAIIGSVAGGITGVLLRNIVINNIFIYYITLFLSLIGLIILALSI